MKVFEVSNRPRKNLNCLKDFNKDCISMIKLIQNKQQKQPLREGFWKKGALKFAGKIIEKDV